MKVQTVYVDGYEIALTRRRYGDTTFTWAHAVQENGTFLPIGYDPFPCLRPSTADLRNDIATTQQEIEAGTYRYMDLVKLPLVLRKKEVIG